MRSQIALSFSLIALAACGGRTQVDDLDNGPDHNQTLTGGSAGAASAGKGGTTSKGGSAGSGTSGNPPTAGSGPTPVGTGGSGTVGGIGGAGAVGGSGAGATAGTSGTAGTAAAGKGGGTSTGGSGTGTGGTGAGAFGGACDAQTQTGCAPGKKCSAEQKGMGQLSSSCVDVTGDVMEGGDCKRTSIGHDNCGPGLICTGVGVVDYDPNKNPPHRQCRKFCSADGDCGMTQGCTQFTQDNYGVCVDSCLPFSACDPAPPTATGSAGNNGGSNMTCSAVLTDNDQNNAFLGCHVVGKGTFNSQCQTDKDCAAGYFCGGGGGPMQQTCTQLCDGTHPCDDKKTSCSATGTDLGTCQ